MYTVLAYDADGTLIYGDNIDWRLVTPDGIIWGMLDSSSSSSNTLWNPVF